MGENVFYTKGDRETVLNRLNQVHTITMYCPLEDPVMQGLKNSFAIMLTDYCTEDNTWKSVPAIDVLRCFLYTKSFISQETDTSVLEIIMASLKAFLRLKYITFVFTDDHTVMESYMDIINHNSHEIKQNIYKVDTLEFNLVDLFSQEIIDLFNKVLISNEILSNEYLERDFIINFKFDEYISFMDMFLGNNGPYLHRLDDNICDYFRKFPDKLEIQKPNIRVITNYSEL